MNPTTDLDEYRCRRCGRLFYVKAAERRPLDLDFGCPYGCDDNGERVRSVVAQDSGDAESVPRIKDCRIVIELSEAEFERSMGRKARDQEECENWAHLVKKGLLNGHIDWDSVYECLRGVMSGDRDG